MQGSLKNKERFFVDGECIEVAELTDKQKELRKEINKKVKEYLKGGK